ncbi:dual specificity phosphatase [Colletotrichum karsti]|uniref:protein-tyrosine-phosphatase n=1 Tax=Colletotrichum karsti TaxID=1095194 RepID=A0A9P6IFR4_9PEZI|nr:dual specificity phosphatase [Colletotrichum karsti]KAF9882019.1 dual specificity phosphatase [Colletotrichum karsti]
MDSNQPHSTKWSDLFSINSAHEPTSYKALDNLQDEPTLAFLHQPFWDEIRAWTRNDDTQMSEIKHPDLTGPGRIYIGGMNHALNEDVLRQRNIRAVITIHPKDSLAWDQKDAGAGLRRFFREEGGGIESVVEHPLIIPLEDNANSNLIEHFDETSAFIREHSGQDRNILIHCKSGRSRSVAVLIAYLQRKYRDEVLRSVTDKDVARKMMKEYREAATESIRQQRLPVKVIMERFQELLALYDLQLIDHPDLEKERTKLFPAPVSAVRVMPSRLDSILKDPAEGAAAAAAAGDTSASESMPPPPPPSSDPKVVKTKGGAAVLKICVAWVFFRARQTPTEAVVHQFFEINEAYFYELEGLDYNGRSYAGSRHMCPGLVAFCLEYAGKFELTLPEKTEQHALLVIKQASS